jgi:hypothetical protein
MPLINALDLPVPADRARALEAGNILFFPQIPFDFPKSHTETLLGASQSGGALHKNIAYRPHEDRVSGLSEGSATSRENVCAAVRAYSQAAVRFVGDLLPEYSAAWKVDYASFRGIEEQGRRLALKKRNDLLHTDAFPTRPTNGDLILRFFTNINPGKMRVWNVSDPFTKLAPERALDAGLMRIAARADSPVRTLRRAARAIGLPVIDRSPYDAFMLGFHDYLKANRDYQRSTTKYHFEFPPNSAWMVFTDVVPHSVLSGQHALEQTFIVSRSTLAAPELAPAAILERLARRRLTY